MKLVIVRCLSTILFTCKQQKIINLYALQAIEFKFVNRLLSSWDETRHSEMFVNMLCLSTILFTCKQLHGRRMRRTSSAKNFGARAGRQQLHDDSAEFSSFRVFPRPERVLFAFWWKSASTQFHD